MKSRIFSLYSNPIFILANVIVMASLIYSMGPVGFFFGFFISLLGFWASGWQWSFYGIGKPNWKKTIPQAILISILIFLFVDVLIQPFIEKAFGQIDLSGFDWLKGNIAGLLTYLAIAWTLAAIGEELVFRGFVQKRLALVLKESQNGWLLAAIVSSIIFGIAHTYQGSSGIISTGLIGFILALVFMKNKSNLVLPMLIHGFYDTLGLMLLYLDLERVLVDPVTRFSFGN